MPKHKYTTKYVGRTCRCRRCERETSLRLWWAPIRGGPPFTNILRVAYYCDNPHCRTAWRGSTDLLPSKEDLIMDLLTRTLTHDTSNSAP